MPKSEPPPLHHPVTPSLVTGKLPEFDVLVTNPPFSGDHIERTLAFALACRKPWFLLLPQVGPCVQVVGRGEGPAPPG